MFSDKELEVKSQTSEALIPLIDLFAILALLFMLDSDHTITVVKQQSDQQIKKIVHEFEEKRILSKSQDTILKTMELQQEQAAQELARDFSKLLALQQNESASEFRDLVAGMENRQIRALAEQKSTMEERKLQELAQARKSFEETFASRESTIEEEKEAVLAKARQEHERLQAEQKSALKEQMENELTRVGEEHEKFLASQGTALLEKSNRERADALADQKAAMEERGGRDLATARAEFEGNLASMQSALGEEKERALGNARQEFAKAFSEQEANAATLNKKLERFVKAVEAKKKIVIQLKENFRDFDKTVVEVDDKTGKVKLHFQSSYFDRGKHELTDDMKNILRTMIPKYAESIYSNPQAANHVQSLKITGLTSPIYNSKYIDIFDTSGETAEARKYNMELSNMRAMAMYSFIFDEEDMEDFPYRDRLKADMGVSAEGFLKAKPVDKELIGKRAKCKLYDCRQEQAAVLQFQLYPEE